MPIRKKVRHTPRASREQSGLIRGRAPHRKGNAHKVYKTWPYFRSALLLLLSHLVLIAAVARCAQGFMYQDHKIIIQGIIGVGIWLLVFRLAYYLSARATRCPLCRASHFIQGKSKMHPDAYRILPFSYTTTALITAVTRLSVRCMHCGTSFNIIKRAR